MTRCSVVGLVCVIFDTAGWYFPARAQTDTPLVMVLTVDEAVAPPMVEYLKRGLSWAEQQGAELVILQLNTPGGSIDSMNEVIQLIRNSRVPVVVYVAPSGAMAGSAGTVVVLAGHAAAMAPDTAIGAASPVGAQGEDLGETMQAKVKNILKASVRSLAQGRGQRAMELAEQTIENAAAASAEEAVRSRDGGFHRGGYPGPVAPVGRVQGRDQGWRADPGNEGRHGRTCTRIVH